MTQTQQEKKDLKVLVNHIKSVFGSTRPTISAIHNALMDYDGSNAADWAYAVADEL